MNYELAKQLKDAGFPQQIHDDAMYVDSDGRSTHEPTIHWLNGEIAYIPTLSELIAACGDDFIRLDKCAHDWWATGLVDGWDEFNGKTPEEAVANLWLSLNANKR